MNNPFKDYTEKSMSEVQIKAKHKSELAQMMFEKKPKKKPFWNWTKAIFTAPVLATVAIVFFLNFNKEVVQEVLLPPEALAQALENTFNLESFETTFGLPEDGKPHHRIMTYFNNYPQANPDLNHPPEDINLWLYGEDVRLDQFENVYSNFASRTRILNSRMYIASKNLFCHHLNINDSNPNCWSADQPKIPLSISSSGPLYNSEIKLAIDDVKTQSFFDEEKGTGLYLEFSSSKPIQNGQMTFGNFRDGMYQQIIFPNKDDKIINLEEGDYVNQFKDGKYWFKLSLDIDTPFKDEIYFQIQQVNESSYRASINENLDSDRGFDEQAQAASSIYSNDIANNIVKTLMEEEFTEKVKEYTFPQLFLDGVFYSALLPALYINQHPDQFSTPLKAKIIEKNQENIWELNFMLPNSYFVEMANTFQDPELTKENQYTIDLYLNDKKTSFLGYSIKQNNVEVESLWIEDEILPESEASKIFNEEEWNKNVTQ